MRQVLTLGVDTWIVVGTYDCGITAGVHLTAEMAFEVPLYD